MRIVVERRRLSTVDTMSQSEHRIRRVLIAFSRSEKQPTWRRERKETRRKKERREEEEEEMEGCREEKVKGRKEEGHEEGGWLASHMYNIVYTHDTRIASTCVAVHFVHLLVFHVIV